MGTAAKDKTVNTKKKTAPEVSVAKPKYTTTQRAYTLLLRGRDSQDHSWQDKLWKTHEAVNKGAKVFGDWLLTMRGGLDHKLVETKVKTKDSEREPTEEEKRDRRILLALSWLSVESKYGAPPASSGLLIASADEPQADRNLKVIAALEDVLKSQGLNNVDIHVWIKDCGASLSAAIRDDAVWVNRSKAFDVVCKGQDENKARQGAQMLLWYLLTDDYLALTRSIEEKKPTMVEGEEDQESDLDLDRTTDVVAKSGKGAGQRTRHLFSHIFGREKTEGFGKPPRKLILRDHWKNHLSPLVKDSGIPLSDPNVKSKKINASSPTELHREMFSKAASRLAQIWTKQKQQEVERQDRASAEDELKKLENNQSYRPTLDVLDNYCRKRGRASGSLEEYRITARAIEGWERVVAVWGKINGDSAEDIETRISEVKRLQDEDSDNKFGDINLFIDLAEPEYKRVWWHDNSLDPSILKIYVKGWKARAEAVRLKVDAFRHPDPFFHPVFCQFGISRPPIKYGRLDKNLKSDPRIIELRLWNGQTAEDVKLLAVSKRFDAEIGSATEWANAIPNNVSEVARRSRHGIAAINNGSNGGSIRVAHVFDQQEIKSRTKTDDNNLDETGGDEEQEDQKKKKEPSWNGTLQADRGALEGVGHLVSSDSQKAIRAKQRLHWRLTVSLELQARGPWYDYITALQDQSPFMRTIRKDGKKGSLETQYISWQGWPHDEINKPLRMNKHRTALVTDSGLGRKGMGAFILSRLPGLRVLSVDLGHRYAASCVAWQALSLPDFKKEVTGLKVLSGGAAENNLYLHVEKPGKDGKKRAVIYRRIGPDKLDGKPHPAPWARLERQFLIKLQGEDEAARKAGPAEVDAFHKLEHELGHKTLEGHPLQVDELMSDSVRLVRQGLKRHGDRARIAHSLIAKERIKPGAVVEKLTEEERVELLTDAIDLWYNLFDGNRWDDKWAKETWNEHIKPLLKGIDLSRPQDEEDMTATERKKHREEMHKELSNAAKSLASRDNMKLHVLWARSWREEDAVWRKRLRWLRDWTLPRKENPAIRNVGGLSLTRIATIKSLYQVQKAYFQRFTPDGRQMAGDKPLTPGEGFGRTVLDTLEQMRENRVKQLASRIVEAALGIGKEQKKINKKDLKRLDERIFIPCHAVVIENLTHYRPEETRTRRENRQLMTWSSSKVKKYLAEGCQLNGLHLREVQAGYTSRQDSRTGAPGIRCQDVSVKDFMQLPFWRKQVVRAEKKLADGRGAARDRFLCDLNKNLNKKWKDVPKAEWNAKAVRIPHKGGEIFVSADSNSPAHKGIQADLNAAANVGLKALMDPDWEGKWWYVPCNPQGIPLVEKVKGSSVIDFKQSLLPQANGEAPENGGKKRGRAKAGAGQESQHENGAIVNYWHDLAAIPLHGRRWVKYSFYWEDAEKKVIDILRKQAGLS